MKIVFDVVVFMTLRAVQENTIQAAEPISYLMDTLRENAIPCLDSLNPLLFLCVRP